MLSLVEPHHKSAKELKGKGHLVIEKFFYDKKNLNLTFYETKKSMCSGIFKPNLKHLNNYPLSERFEIIREVKINTTTIDEEFKLENIPNFVKMDTQGSELAILNGATESLKHILGLEIECEFFEINEKQPLFSEIQKFLENYNFEFIDFLNIVRWERKKHRFTGQPQFSDVLFLKKPNFILQEFRNNNIKEEKFLKYIVILAIYNRPDLINYLVDNLDPNFVKKFQLNKIYELIEKKISRLNISTKYYKFVKHCINNLIKI